MPLINRIDRLRHPGVLRDFSWPKALDEFARYNLIYGWNGSGKTTISKLFRALELRAEPEGDAALVLDGQKVDGSRFSEASLPIRVFNRDFVSESVFPVGGGDVAPIFVLGRESAEKQTEVERWKSERAQKNETLGAEKSQRSQAENKLDKHCIDQATVIREALRSSGNNPYTNYDKRRYRQRADRIIADGDKDSLLLSEEDHERLLSQNRATPKNKIDKVQYQIPDIEQYQNTASQLLGATVVSSAIAALKDDPELASWTRQGLGLHQERKAENCLFCEQPLPDKRIADLEAHFSAEYEDFLRRLHEQIARLKTELQKIESVELPNEAQFYEDLTTEWNAARGAFDNAKTNIARGLFGVIEALEEKKKKPFDVIRRQFDGPDFDGSFLTNLNDVIQRHNEACEEFDKRVGSARERLESDFVARSLDEYQTLTRDVNAAGAAIKKANTKVQQLEVRIGELEKEIVEHRRPAEELNEDLRNYLGHGELQLEVKDTGYVISRNGKPAKSLSEGEMTAIALLYFLKSLQDRRFEIGKGVVVLDDPVSSLDANALFLAFGFIQRRTEDAAQLFILTHNFSFFRQVKEWFRHLNKKNRRLYMLECVAGVNCRDSYLQRLDPLLDEYESEYHYLFARIYRRAMATGERGLEANYVFPNMARRLLETFLAFRQPDCASGLRGKLKRIEYDQAKKVRIIRFLHTHSHAEEIGEPEHDPSNLSEAGAVLSDLLALIEQEDPTHYLAMTTLVDPPVETEASV